ncbi:MAG: glycosyltransferase family 1 protein [Gemmataceae bacterium]
MTTEPQTRSLWVDVSTLAGWRGNPTGIARTLQGLVQHWLPDDRLPVRLCRFDAVGGGFVEVAAAELMRGRSPAPPPPAPPKPVPLPSRRWSSLYWHRLNTELRDGSWHLYHALRCGGRLARSVVRATAANARRAARGFSARRPPLPFQPGDALFLGGTGWSDGPPLAALADLRRTLPLKVAHLIYDITPLRVPHLCAPAMSRAFARWLPAAVTGSDLIVTISRYSRKDLEGYCRDQGLTPPPVVELRIGDEPGDDDSAAPPPDLIARNPGSFALFVSSMALHKNQPLLFAVWRRLIERHGGGVPTLVLVGGPGWRAEQILADLAADATLSRHVAYLPRTDDRQLRWLYRNCLFTLFPSHYEGWGLPVAESLRHGKYCVCSAATSLPEVGGELVDYHDPLDGVGCLRLVERALFEPGFLAGREERIRTQYRCTGWKETAAAAFAAVDRHFGLLPSAAREAA